MSKHDETKYDKRGFIAEDAIIDRLVYKDCKLVKSTLEDDIKRDIDAYHEHLGNVSIKSQGVKYFNFAIEVGVAAFKSYVPANGGVEAHHTNIIDGWWQKSEADTYLVARRDDNKGIITEVLFIDAHKLREYVKANPVRTTWALHARANNKGRYHDLPYVNLYSLKKLKAEGIIYHIEKFD